MRNYVQIGDLIPITAPAAVVSGQGLLVGAMFGVCTKSAASGELVTLQTLGVVDLPKAATITPAQGALLYWDDTAKAVTSTVGSNTKIGVAVVVPAAGDATIRVRLNGAF
jgi:predicted RecA/RadA family phage recombinase